MREIKFRAWYKPFRLISEPFNPLKAHYGVKFNGGPYDTQDLPFVPRKFVFMQYTGLKDKNGVEIYEGNILSHDAYKYPIEVTHGEYTCSADDISSDESFGFYGKSKTPNSGGFFDVNPMNFQWMEVIGNIYENPELIRKES